MVEPKKTKKRRATSAPGQYYGYSMVQGARLLHRLLQATPDETVSIEGLDDISVDGDRGLLVEQDKSGLAHNPVADKSLDLWKTLRNWLEGLRNGQIPAGSKFVLYVAQSHTGSVVERLHICRSAADGGILAQALRLEFWGNGPEYLEKLSNTASLREHLDPVLEASDEVLGEIFHRFEFVQGCGSPYDEIKSLLKLKAIGEDAIEQTHDVLIGWCQKKVAKCIEARQLPAVCQPEFHKQLLACARKFDRADKELISALHPISEAEIKEHLQVSVYVKQMCAVGLADDHLTDAIDEYLRAAADRAHWGIRGYVLEESFSDYQNELTKNWRRKRQAEFNDGNGKAEEKIGQALFLSCMNVRLPLQRMQVPEYFTPGAFHALADTCKIGWHPRFMEILNSMSAKK